MAVVRPSSTSTSGRASVGMKPCTNALYVSLISRCDSAAIVPNTSELLPDPDTPVNAVSRRFGSSTLTSLRLLTRAPWTRMTSWPSAVCWADFARAFLAGMPSSWSMRSLRCCDCRGSAELLDADQVARRVAKGAVADSVRLVGGLLDDLCVGGLQPLEGAVEVVAGQQQRAVGALGHHLGDGALLVVGDAGARCRRVEDDARVGLARRADGDPADLVVADVESDLEAEYVAVERDRGVGVVVRQEARVNRDVHVRHATWGRGPDASRFLTGLLTCFSTQAGMPAVVFAGSRR